MKVSLFLNLDQYLTLSSFRLSSNQIGEKWYFIVNLHVLDLCEAEHLFVYLLAILSFLNFQCSVLCLFFYCIVSSFCNMCNGYRHLKSLRESDLSIFSLWPLHFVSCLRGPSPSLKACLGALQCSLVQSTSTLNVHATPWGSY